MPELQEKQTYRRRCNCAVRLAGTMRWLTVAPGALLASIAPTVAAEPPTSSGKTVTIVVGYSVGGGFDLYA